MVLAASPVTVHPAAPERVALDSSVLLGANRSRVIAAAALGYYLGFWSPWIVAEFVRQRTEWIAERAVREGCDRRELRRRLRASRNRVNALVADLSRDLHSVDESAAPPADLSWLTDPDDWPVMRTALAARADTLVTDNTSDFPQNEERNSVLIMSSTAFLFAIAREFPEAEAEITRYLDERR